MICGAMREGECVAESVMRIVDSSGWWLTKATLRSEWHKMLLIDRRLVRTQAEDGEEEYMSSTERVRGG